MRCQEGLLYVVLQQDADMTNLYNEYESSIKLTICCRKSNGDNYDDMTNLYNEYESSIKLTI